MNKPFAITEDQYNHDKMDFGKKEFIVYDNVCTPPVTLYTLDDKTMEGFIGKDLLMAAREMSQDERMYVRNPEMEIDMELLRAEGDYRMNIVFHVTRILNAIDGIDQATSKPIFRKITQEEDCGLFATKEGALNSIKTNMKLPDDVSSKLFESLPDGDIYRIPFKSTLPSNYKGSSSKEFEWHYQIKERIVH